MKILIIISSKSPNDKLLNCIYLLYKIQIANDCNSNDYKICVIDSDSNDFNIYNQINSACRNKGHMRLRRSLIRCICIVQHTLCSLHHHHQRHHHRHHQHNYHHHHHVPS